MIYLPLSTAVWCSGMFVQQIGWAAECSLPMKMSAMSLEQFPSYHFLSPANEVLGKVMFSHLSVILFTGRCLPHCMLGYIPPPGPEADIPRADTPLGRHPQDTTGYSHRAGGTHPTVFMFTIIPGFCK